MVKPGEPLPVEIVSPQPTPVVVVTDAERARRKAMEKEIMGLSAKLRWDHMAESVKDVWRARIAELEELLRVQG